MASPSPTDAFSFQTSEDQPAWSEGVFDPRDPDRDRHLVLVVAFGGKEERFYNQPLSRTFRELFAAVVAVGIFRKGYEVRIWSEGGALTFSPLEDGLVGVGLRWGGKLVHEGVIHSRMLAESILAEVIHWAAALDGIEQTDTIRERFQMSLISEAFWGANDPAGPWLHS